jgi:hypothetical protein
MGSSVLRRSALDVDGGADGAIGEVFTLGQIYGLLTEACADAGGQKVWGEHHGISPSHVCDVLNARRDPGPAILQALGLERAVRYVRVSIPNR